MSSADAGDVLLALVAAPSAAALVADGNVASEADADGIHRALAPLHRAGELTIVERRRNGARHDVRVRNGDGAWLVVLWNDDADRVVEVDVYERPPVFAGRPGGLVIVLNGPSSVGKSSLMRAFADRAVTPFAWFDEPWLGRVPPRFTAWPDTLGPWVGGFLAALAAAAARGNQFVVSAAGIPQGEFRAALGVVPTVSVGLDAPLEVLVERQRRQRDKFGGLAEESVDIHDGWTYDLRIDTAEHGPEAAARLLEAHLARRV